jgi:hypothetical protein
LQGDYAFDRALHLRRIGSGPFEAERTHHGVLGGGGFGGREGLRGAGDPLVVLLLAGGRRELLERANGESRRGEQMVEGRRTHDATIGPIPGRELLRRDAAEHSVDGAVRLHAFVGEGGQRIGQDLDRRSVDSLEKSLGARREDEACRF